MNRVRLLPTLFYGIICLFLQACSENILTENQDNNLYRGGEKTENLFPAFDQFPEKQFKTLCLGESQKNLEKQISNMPVEIMAEEEDSYFYFPADSSEIILPMDVTLNEFKVFLKGNSYLENSANFRKFLGEKSTKSALNEDFPLYFYETNLIDFKMTYFKQETFIRLHFILL